MKDKLGVVRTSNYDIPNIYINIYLLFVNSKVTSPNYPNLSFIRNSSKNTK